MDLLKLDPITYTPMGDVIGGISSLIWTEKYLTPGEFELKTPKIAEMSSLLPLGSFVTLRDTREVMRVETHEITKDSNGKARSLSIKGRTLDYFLENRALEGPVSNKKYRMSRLLTPAETAGALIWNAFVNPTTEDITRTPVAPDTRDLLDTIPGVAVSDSTTVSATKKRRWLTGGQVNAPVLNVLKAGGLGLRVIRPPTLGPVQVLRWGSNSETGILRTERSNEDRLLFDIYNGTDRRSTSANPLIFSTAQKHLTDDTYLKSIALFKTMVLIVPGRLDARKYYRDKAEDATLSGWDRSVIWADGGEPDLEEIPERPDDDASAAVKTAWREKRDRIKERNAIVVAEFREDLRELADLKLREGRYISLLEAKATDQSSIKYNQHYFLGDRVTLMGDYGFKEHVQVVEYVRTYDGKTVSGYPGFATIE